MNCIENKIQPNNSIPPTTRILSSDSISDLFEIVSKFSEEDRQKLLVLSDIDLTLICSKTTVDDSLLWDWNLKKTIRVKNLPKEEANNFLTPLIKYLDSMGSSVALEGEKTKEVVRSVQKIASLIPCTARRPNTSEELFKQLKLAEIPLDYGNNKNFPLVKINDQVCAEYKNGVIFAGSVVSKGEVIQKFLSTSSHQYKCVILIDDLMDNISQMAKAVNAIALNFIGLHYTKFKKAPLNDEDAISFLAPIIGKNPQFDQFHYLIEK